MGCMKRMRGSISSIGCGSSAIVCCPRWRGILRGKVNSAHHQAIGRLGDGLKINCHAEDGTIEGIEWAEPDGKPFLLAVQWHPERMLANGFEDEFLYRALRDRFIEEVRLTQLNRR